MMSIKRLKKMAEDEFCRDMFQGEYDAIPYHMRGAIYRYLANGTQPGHFLTAVLSNDLVGAVSRADSTNKPLIPLYVTWLYNRAPSGAWGSVSAYELTINMGGCWGAHS